MIEYTAMQVGFISIFKVASAAVLVYSLFRALIVYTALEPSNFKEALGRIMVANVFFIAWFSTDLITFMVKMTGGDPAVATFGNLTSFLALGGLGIIMSTLMKVDRFIDV